MALDPNDPRLEKQYQTLDPYTDPRLENPNYKSVPDPRIEDPNYRSTLDPVLKDKLGNPIEHYYNRDPNYVDPRIASGANKSQDTAYPTGFQPDPWNPDQNPTNPTVVTPPPPPPPPPPVVPDPTGGFANPQLVPSNPSLPGQSSVVDYSGQTALNPALGFTGDMLMSQNTPTITPDDAQAGIINPNDPRFQMNSYEGTQNATLTNTALQQNYQAVGNVANKDAQGYDVAETQQNVEQNGQMDAAQGTVNPNAQIEAPQLDVDATARSENEVGKALDKFANQDLNTVDPKATLKGQIDILQQEFVGPNGEPKIPVWAAGVARNVSKIAAFNGMTGTAGVAAMSQALFESSVSVAAQDAQFFQTLTMQNLNNEQASIINKANTLSKMDMANLDSRLAAAIQNSKNFMDMDLTNLNNEQQAQVINSQARFQSILEDAKAKNTERMFTSQDQTERDKFYDNLNTQISQYNAEQYNQMQQFNATTANETGMFNATAANQMKQFNSNLQTQREQFYREMQYNIDVSNAKWRQTVTLTNNKNSFDAASRDVQNMVDFSQEQLNQLWDRSDAQLDYLWKSSENDADRKQQLALAKLQGDLASKAATDEGIGSIFGTIFGKLSENVFDRIFG